MREKPLNPWIIAENRGNILAGHNNCMARLGEACSNIGLLLRAVEVGVRMREPMAVT